MVIMYRLDGEKQALDKSGKQNEVRDSSGAPARQIIAYIDQHLLDGISLETVSKQMHISASHLIRILKKEAGYTYLQYATKKKMEKAAEFLEKENLKVYEVSERLGYNSTRYFSTLFFRQFGCYPSEYFGTLGKNRGTGENGGLPK